jgi:formamidopyrimidine-DNA glycosylase
MRTSPTSTHNVDMPEGDTVWRTARRLHEVLAGRALTHTDFRVPRFAAVQLAGHTVHDVQSRGKHLLIHVEPDMTVHSHLGMDGAWRVFPLKQRPPQHPRSFIRVILATQSHRAVGYDLSVLDVLTRDEETVVLQHLGPDLLGPDWDPAEAERRLSSDPDRPIGDALLDQRNLAGIGNVFKCELCFLRGVSPWTPVQAAGDLTSWVDLAHRVLMHNRDRSPRITASHRAGHAYWVYGRRECQRCGGPVRRVQHDDLRSERVTYWCPHCQPGPGPAEMG